MAATDKRQFIPGPGGMGDLPFSNAVIAGSTVYLSGHIGFDPATRKPPEDAEQEARLVLDGLRDTLTRSGLSLQDVVSLTVYCPDLSLFERFNAVYRTYFRAPFPARAFIGSGPLLFGARFEIQGIAVKPEACHWLPQLNSGLIVFRPLTVIRFSETGISFCKNGIFAAAQSTRLSPERPNIAAVACPGSSVKFPGMPTEPIACVAASGCASQYENAAALTKNRIARFSAFVRTHSAAGLGSRQVDSADKLARFNTWSPCPATNNAQKCAEFAGIVHGLR